MSSIVSYVPYDTTMVVNIVVGDGLMPIWHQDICNHHGYRSPQYSKGMEKTEPHHDAYMDGLVQERCNSSVLAMELHLSCINPSIYASPGSNEFIICLLPKNRVQTTPMCQVSLSIIYDPAVW